MLRIGGGYLKIPRGAASRFSVLEKSLGSRGWNVEQGRFVRVRIAGGETN